MAERLYLEYSAEPSVEIEAYLRVLEEEIPKGYRRLCLGVEGCELSKVNHRHFWKYCTNRGRSEIIHSSCMNLK
ncbi:MAG TPA: hypothetical protein VMC80_03150 [Patescibacteria group bacterium]|nr:hypothetical protein [Patescibacteria group bacterium]